MEGMSRQCQAANLGGAAVQHVEQYALALPHFDWLSVSKHAAIDREGVVSDFVPMRQTSRE